MNKKGGDCISFMIAPFHLAPGMYEKIVANKGKCPWCDKGTWTIDMVGVDG
jgi:hypothetical protein